MRLINADALRDKKKQAIIIDHERYGCEVVEFIEIINAPTINTAHGRWEINSDGYYPYCSNCKTEPENGKMTNYCPNCGAKMDSNDSMRKVNVCD